MKRDLPAFVYPKGKRGYLYFVRPGTCQRIHAAPGTPEFYAEYTRLLRGRIVVPKQTISKLIVSYRQSRRWADLAYNTRKSYERSLAYFEKSAGNVDPATLQRVHIIQMQKALSDKPTDANRKIGALSVLLEHAIDIGWMKDNPAKGIKSLPATGKVRKPWPADLIEAFRATATGRTALLFELLLGTGQRINDVLALRWSDMDGDGFTIKQGKTKRELFIPLTDRLRAVLDATPKRSMFIVCQSNGRPVGYNLAWKDIREVREKIGAQEYDIHALRHAAASEIASIPGLTSEHVMAITGHSAVEMVRLYAGKAMQKARAQEAQDARNKSRQKSEP